MTYLLLVDGLFGWRRCLCLLNIHQTKNIYIVSKNPEDPRMRKLLEFLASSGIYFSLYIVLFFHTVENSSCNNATTL